MRPIRSDDIGDTHENGLLTKANSVSCAIRK